MQQLDFVIKASHTQRRTSWFLVCKYRSQAKILQFSTERYILLDIVTISQQNKSLTGNRHLDSFPWKDLFFLLFRLSSEIWGECCFPPRLLLMSYVRACCTWAYGWLETKPGTEHIHLNIYTYSEWTTELENEKPIKVNELVSESVSVRLRLATEQESRTSIATEIQHLLL